MMRRLANTVSFARGVTKCASAALQKQHRSLAFIAAKNTSFINETQNQKRVCTPVSVVRAPTFKKLSFSTVPLLRQQQQQQLPTEKQAQPQPIANTQEASTQPPQQGVDQNQADADGVKQTATTQIDEETRRRQLEARQKMLEERLEWERKLKYAMMRGLRATVLAVFSITLLMLTIKYKFGDKDKDKKEGEEEKNVQDTTTTTSSKTTPPPANPAVVQSPTAGEQKPVATPQPQPQQKATPPPQQQPQK
eukprot:GEZU01008896.1.p1 GENE.GEZU01008896.1~~GEZU01008896.1.p1  ORF type:complete len:250 (-),score=81.80 GEZU01008896.1:74-823(-)